MGIPSFRKTQTGRETLGVDGSTLNSTEGHLDRQNVQRRLVADRVTPNRKLAILTCFDATVDPLFIFGLQPGDAIVYRTPGGYAPDGMTLITLQIAVHLLNVQHVIVLHHTPCLMSAPNLLPPELSPQDYPYLISDPLIALNKTHDIIQRTIQPHATVSSHLWDEMNNTIYPPPPAIPT